jgi:hypothetical protein
MNKGVADRMFALGQPLPNRAFRVISLLPPFATGLRTSKFGSFVPTSDIERRLASGRHNPSAGNTSGLQCGDLNFAHVVVMNSARQTAVPFYPYG